MRSLYLASCICRNQPRHCAVINVPPLLRELILHAAQLGALDARVPAQKRLAEVIADQLTLLSPEERQRLPMPRDPRALSLARRLMDDPDCDASLTTLAAKAGASARTIQRLFLNETQLSFARWRQRMRLLAAVERLAAGSSVTNAALDVGYHSVSAFVSSFRKEFGASPGRLGRKG
jgi:AraC-like DNA-binding protein